MRNYVATVTAKILLLSNKLTPLLESIIIRRPELLLCVKERLVEKLVLWMLEFIENNNNFSSAKISNLLCKIVEHYPVYLAQTDESIYSFELENLAQNLSPLYRQLISGEHAAVEHCVVEVAVAHTEILKTCLTQTLANDFLKLGITLVERNGGVLNKCLELFSQLLGSQHMHKFQKQPDYVALREVNLWAAAQLLPKCREWLQEVELRDENVWQMATLIEIVLFTFEATGQKVDPHQLDFCKLLDLTNSSQSKVVHLKIIEVALLLMRMNPSPEL
jgi:hypothetical protein